MVQVGWIGGAVTLEAGCEFPPAGGCEVAGTCTIALHCGQLALRPAALAGTFKARPQPEQWNSMVSALVVGWDMGGR